jgi:hypothetical protein
MKAKRTWTVVVAGLAVAGLIGAACGGDGERSGGAAPDVAGELPDGRTGEGGGPGAAPGFEPPDAGPGGLGAVPAAVPRIGPRIVKTGSLSLRVQRGVFQDRFQQATLVAGRYGGFVASSQTGQGKHRSGSLVIRVPADRFEQALGDLKRLGRIESQSISGQDVTGQVVDLEARLRNWQAQETVLLRLMAKADTIEDSIVVQRQLQEVQLAIEELRGQLRVLDDQTAFATVTLSMAEVGFVPARSKTDGLSFGRGWQLAVDGFVAVFAAVLVGLGYLIPLGLIALAVLAGMLGYRRLRRPQPADTPAT